LGSIGVLSGIGHAEKANLGVLELEVLIGELGAVDWELLLASTQLACIDIRTRLSTSAIALGEVSTLNHEVLDNTVEGRILVSETLLAGRQSSEVLNCLGDSPAVKTHYDAAHGLVAMADIEVHLMSDLGAFCGIGSLGEEDEGEGDDEEDRDYESLHGEHRGGGDEIFGYFRICGVVEGTTLDIEREERGYGTEEGAWGFG